MDEPSSSTAKDGQPRKDTAKEQRKRRNSQRGTADSQERQGTGAEASASSSNNTSELQREGVLLSPFEVYETPPQWSAYTAIRELLQSAAETAALVDSEVSVARDGLLTHLRDFAAFFQLRKVSAADRVFVCLSNGVINLLATYAAVCAGATVILAKPSLSEAELQTLITESDSMFVLTDVPTAPKMVKATAAIKIRAMFSTGIVEGGFHCLTSFVNKKGTKPNEFPLANPEKCVLAICYTSGATGAPKPVQFTHRAFVANCCNTRRHLDWGPSDVVACTFDMAALPGLLFPIMSVLCGARCVIAPHGVNPKDLHATIEKQKVTCLCSTPDEVDVLVQTEKPRNSGKSLSFVALSGSRVPCRLRAALFEAFRNVKRLMNLYTLSEAGGLVCIPQAGSASLDSVGRPAPMVKLMIVQIEGNRRLGPNEAGEIYFHSPIATPGYYKKPLQRAVAYCEGLVWHKTGDVGFYDNAENLHVIQRVSEMLSFWNGMVAPSQVEDIILETYSEDVDEVVVFKLGRRDCGSAAAAAVVLKNERRSKKGFELAKKIKDTVAEKMGGSFTLGGGVLFLDEIPLTEFGKVDRTAVLQAAIFRGPICADAYAAQEPDEH